MQKEGHKQVYYFYFMFRICYLDTGYLLRFIKKSYHYFNLISQVLRVTCIISYSRINCFLF